MERRRRWYSFHVDAGAGEVGVRVDKTLSSFGNPGSRSTGTSSQDRELVTFPVVFNAIALWECGLAPVWVLQVPCLLTHWDGMQWESCHSPAVGKGVGQVNHQTCSYLKLDHQEWIALALSVTSSICNTWMLLNWPFSQVHISPKCFFRRSCHIF